MQFVCIRTGFHEGIRLHDLLELPGRARYYGNLDNPKRLKIDALMTVEMSSPPVDPVRNTTFPL